MKVGSGIMEMAVISRIDEKGMLIPLR